METDLAELLKSCTVKLSIPNKAGWGTGFFIAPDRILTCAHVVVKAAGSDEAIKISWQEREDFPTATTERFIESSDLALLRLNSPIKNLPCVYLDKEIEPKDDLYTFGYPDDFPNGAPVTFSYEGLTGDSPPLMKFKLGQARPGLSGSPLLNMRTGKVCGMAKFTRDRGTDLGGGGVPMTVICSEFKELEGWQREFHERNQTWNDCLRNSNGKDRFHEKIILSRDLRDIPVNSIDISTDGQVLASGDDEGIVRVWNLDNGKEIRVFKAHNDSINSIVITSDKSVVISGGKSGYGRVWQLSTSATYEEPEKLHCDRWHSSAIRSIAMSKKEGPTQILVSGSGGGSIEVRCLRQEIQDSQNIVTVTKRYKFLAYKLPILEAVHSLSVSADGRFLAVSTGTKKVKIWRLNFTRETPYDFPEMHDESVESVAISSDGQIVVSGDKNGQMMIWDLATHKKQSCQSNSAINSLAIVANGRFFASGNEKGQVEIWDSLNGNRVFHLGGHAKPVCSVAISADGCVVASSSQNGEVKVWRRERNLTG